MARFLRARQVELRCHATLRTSLPIDADQLSEPPKTHEELQTICNLQRPQQQSNFETHRDTDSVNWAAIPNLVAFHEETPSPGPRRRASWFALSRSDSSALRLERSRAE